MAFLTILVDIQNVALHNDVKQAISLANENMLEKTMAVKLDRRAFLGTGVTGAVLATIPGVLNAQSSHEVQMLNKHPENPRLRQVFFPRVIVVEAGDTVDFVATDKTHNSASIDGMSPEGAEEWKGRVNENISVTFDKPGFYGYQCTPHAATGMVGLVVVKGEGMMDNLEAAQEVRQRGKARQVWEEIWEEVDAMDLSA